MSDEPHLREVNGDENQPATKADVRSVQDDVDKLAQATAKTFERIEQRMATKDDIATIHQRFGSLDDRIGRLERGQAAILSVVQGIDEQLKEFRTHPARIERLEHSVFRR